MYLASNQNFYSTKVPSFSEGNTNTLLKSTANKLIADPIQIDYIKAMPWFREASPATQNAIQVIYEDWNGFDQASGSFSNDDLNKAIDTIYDKSYRGYAKENINEALSLLDKELNKKYSVKFDRRSSPTFSEKKAMKIIWPMSQTYVKEEVISNLAKEVGQALKEDLARSNGTIDQDKLNTLRDWFAFNKSDGIAMLIRLNHNEKYGFRARRNNDIVDVEVRGGFPWKDSENPIIFGEAPAVTVDGIVDHIENLMQNYYDRFVEDLNIKEDTKFTFFEMKVRLPVFKLNEVKP